MDNPHIPKDQLMEAMYYRLTQSYGGFVKTSNRTFTLNTRKRGHQSFTWDPERKHSGLMLLNDNRTVRAVNSNQYKTCYADMCMESGEYYWEVRVDNYVNEEDVFLGVARWGVSLEGSTAPYNTRFFWSYCCSDGQKTGPNTSSKQAFSESSRTGDVIGFRLDMDTGKLEVLKNDRSLGILADDVTGPVYPAVNLYYSGAQVTLHPLI